MTEAAADGGAGREAAGKVRYGGFWRRFVAFWIDAILSCILLFPALGMLGISDIADHPNHMGLIDYVLFNPFFLGAGAFFLYYRQATPGKLLLGLRVVDATTLGKPNLGQILGRQFCYLLSAVAFLLGFLWVAVDWRKRGWHDLLAGTVVIRK